MASPFRAFRKYQKSLLAVAGVVLMFVFVLGDPLSQYLRRSVGDRSGTGQHPTDVAVTWNGGQLTNAELGQLVLQRMVVNGFVRQVEALGRQAAIEAGGDAQPLRVEMIVGPDSPQEGVERSVVQTRIFADAARKAGMAISDDHISNYLLQLGRGKVSVDDLRAVLNSLQVGGRRASTDYVLDALREEMLARNYMASCVFAFDTNLPEERWRDWLKVNDRVVVEAAAVPAETLIVDVPEPTEAELVAFFDQYKNDEPAVDREWGIELPWPTPGFKVPRKVAVQYLLADYNQYLAKVESEVTDAEIEKFYEDNKDPYFIRAESVLSEPAEETDEAASQSEDASEDKAGGNESPDANKVPQSDEKSSVRQRSSPFRLAAFADEAPAGSEEESKSASEAAASADEAAADAPTAALDAPAEKPKEFQPLDEVRDEIRREIAQIKVTDQLEQLMNSLESELNVSYQEYFGVAADAAAEGKDVPPAPAALANLTPLAEANGLVYQTTEPATWQQLRDTPVGKSSRPEWRGVPFYYAIFSREFELYQPIATEDLDANRFLAMKTLDIPGKVPTLDEIRDDVVRAWKLRKAGELAVKRADELAEKARSTGASLTDALADEKSVTVVKTDPFSFLTVGTVSTDSGQAQSFRLSEPDDIVAAGPALMEKVFSLKDGDVATAPNHDNSIVYVVRAVAHEKTPAELRQAFLEEADTWSGILAMATQRFQLARALWASDIQQSSDIHWERSPDEPFREEAKTDES